MPFINTYPHVNIHNLRVCIKGLPEAAPDAADKLVLELEEIQEKLTALQDRQFEIRMAILDELRKDWNYRELRVVKEVLHI